MLFMPGLRHDIVGHLFSVPRFSSLSLIRCGTEDDNDGQATSEHPPTLAVIGEDTLLGGCHIGRGRRGGCFELGSFEETGRGGFLEIDAGTFSCFNRTIPLKYTYTHTCMHSP